MGVLDAVADIFTLGSGDMLLGRDPGILREREVRSAPKWNKGQQKLFDESLLPMFQGGYEPLETLSIEGLDEFSRALMAGGTGTGMSLDALSRVTGMGPQDFDEYFTTNVQGPLLEDFQDEILPGISRSYAQSGFFGSDRERTDRMAQEELLQQLVGARSKFAYESQNSQLNRLIQAAGLGAGIDSTAVGTYGRIGEAAAAPKNRRISQILAALGLQPTENIAFGDVVDPGSEGILGDLIAAFGAYAAGKK